MSPNEENSGPSKSDYQKASFFIAVVALCFAALAAACSLFGGLSYGRTSIGWAFVGLVLSVVSLFLGRGPNRLAIGALVLSLSAFGWLSISADLERQRTYRQMANLSKSIEETSNALTKSFRQWMAKPPSRAPQSAPQTQQQSAPSAQPVSVSGIWEGTVGQNGRNMTTVRVTLGPTGVYAEYPSLGCSAELVPINRNQHAQATFRLNITSGPCLGGSVTLTLEKPDQLAYFFQCDPSSPCVGYFSAGKLYRSR